MRVRIIALAAAIAACAPAASADYCPTSISWKGWEVTSSENLFAGHKHTSYPLTYLFDGDAATAWVFSGDYDARKLKHESSKESYDGRMILTITTDKPLTMDSIRIMNGYNKSKDLYYKNDRISEIKIIIDGPGQLGADEPPAGESAPYSKKFSLPDQMGFHTLKFDRRQVSKLTIEITAVRMGDIDDVCISELEMYDGDNKIDPHMPAVVRYSKGDECGCGQQFSAVRRDGLCVLEPVEMDYGGELPDTAQLWSPDMDYFAGVSKKDHVLVIVSTQSGQIVLKQPIGKNRVAGMSWTDAATLDLELKGAKPHLTVKVPPGAK